MVPIAGSLALRAFPSAIGVMKNEKHSIAAFSRARNASASAGMWNPQNLRSMLWHDFGVVKIGLSWRFNLLLGAIEAAHLWHMLSALEFCPFRRRILSAFTIQKNRYRMPLACCKHVFLPSSGIFLRTGHPQ
mmetsp:Transcript_11150/g.28155  ORF Transcript_11150/g.28155 Transcript_11150/m.28155 type:complete len:132 (-) Transcript_11150:781-1176(-)